MGARRSNTGARHLKSGAQPPFAGQNILRKEKGNKKERKDSMAFKVLFLFNTEIF